jgi:hypothetical protein
VTALATGERVYVRPSELIAGASHGWARFEKDLTPEKPGSNHLFEVRFESGVLAHVSAERVVLRAGLFGIRWSIRSDGARMAGLMPIDSPELAGKVFEALVGEAALSASFALSIEVEGFSDRLDEVDA